jgi:hypothetical protein
VPSTAPHACLDRASPTLTARTRTSIWSTVSYSASSIYADSPERLARAIAYGAVQDLIELFRHNTWANAKSV